MSNAGREAQRNPNQVQHVLLRGLSRLGLGMGFAIVGAVTALGQPSDGITAARPKNCHVLLVMPTARLYVDTKWVGSLTHILLDNRYHGTCPTEPVVVGDEGVDFGRTILDVLNIHSGLGRAFFRLHVESPPAKDAFPQKPPSGDAPIEASIEMRRSDNERGFQNRWYDIHYKSPDQRLSGSTHVICGNATRGPRNCAPGPFPTFAGLMLNFSLSLAELPVPDAVSTDPSTEPGAVLQFDQRLRQWLVSLERPPDKAQTGR